jgi:hypothetical protein
MPNVRVENAMAIEGMTGREALALMDIFVRRATEQTGGSRFAEFGAYKGRTACLLAQNIGSDGSLEIVESADYLEFDRIRAYNSRANWHRERSESFTAERLPAILAGSLLTATHHDASHFFSNVHTELKNIQPLMHESGVIILDDFNDIYAQVRAAFYYLRYTASFPFEVLLIGFNKCFLVHSDHFKQHEAFVLDRLLDIAEGDYGLPLRLARTDNHPQSRGFCVTKRADPAGERRYGIAFFGDRFYKPTA